MSVNTAGVDAADRVRVIGFGRRLGAMLIDSLIIAFMTFTITFMIGFVFLFFDMFVDTRENVLQAAIALAGITFSFFYWIGSWSANGQSIGQSTLGMTVVGKDGQKLSKGKAFLRYIGFVISALFFGLGFIWVAFDKKRQGWHDKIAGSYVIDMDDDFPVDGKAEFVPSDHGHPWILAIVWAIIAFATPVGGVAIYLTLGPAVGRFMMNLIGQ
jgi:uncharacterized RDD family membrane protein YckC